MAEPADVQAHWTRPGVLARIDAALTELGHDPQNLNPEILATVEHLHSGGFATTRDQSHRIAVTEDSRVHQPWSFVGFACLGSPGNDFGGALHPRLQMMIPSRRTC